MNIKTIFASCIIAGFAFAGCMCTDCDDKNWTNFFDKNGNLNGVTFKEGAWSHVGDGVMRANMDSTMLTTKEYEKFVLEFEYKLDPAANSGVIIYCSNLSNWIPNSVEIQLLDDNANKWKRDPAHYKNGSLYGHLAPSIPGGNAKPAGEWNSMKVFGNGKNVQVVINGKKVIDADLSKWTDAKVNPDGTKIPSWLSRPWAELPTKGYIGFQGKHADASVYIRNARIREIKD